MVACGGETVTVDSQTEGTVKLPLTSPAPDGNVYRLVGATFTITGTKTVTLTDTSADTVETKLHAGSYTAELGGTWRMERLDAPGTSVPVQLLSPNPLPFFVRKGETSEVRFLFKLPGEGTANVGIVVDGAGWLAGTVQFAEREYSGPPEQFDSLIGQSVPFVINLQSYTTMKSSWSKDLYVDATASFIQFGGAPSEILERVAASLKGGRLYFSLSPDSPGTIRFNGTSLMSQSGGPGSFEFSLMYGGRFSGPVDSEGYPIFRPFEFPNTEAAVRTFSGYDGVRGPASLKVSP
jgi:hypothetical protein